MLLESEGIVLQTIKYGETSLISKVLSKEKGLISLISSRPKRKKNRKANYLQPLSAIHFVCYISNKSTIYRVKELGFNPKISSQKEDIAINSIRFFLAEFLSKVIREEEQNIFLYQFIEEEISKFYSEDSNTAVFHIHFLLKLCDQIGITPDLNESGNFFDLIEGSMVSTKPLHADFYDGEAVHYLKQAQSGDFSFSKKQRLQLLNMVINYYNIQLGGGLQHLKSKAVLEVVFS